MSEQSNIYKMDKYRRLETTELHDGAEFGLHESDLPATDEASARHLAHEAINKQTTISPEEYQNLLVKSIDDNGLSISTFRSREAA